ncbi:MAG TPA: hypothetical protein VFI53_08505 [Myxococcaceae bacterium]|nr:hypothetical protein [Myxococcaceae bacterium]
MSDDAQALSRVDRLGVDRAYTAPVRWTVLATLGLLAAAAKEQARAADLPLFVVERSRVIWPQKCAHAATPVPPELQSRMRKELGERGVLVGDGRVDVVTLGAPACLPGDCGSGQFAVPLGVSQAERTGVFVPASKVDAKAIRALKLVGVEGTDPDGLRPGLKPLEHPPPACGDPPAEASSRSPAAGQLVTCLTWLEGNGERGVQVQGRGQLQGNGTALYDVVRFRILEGRPGPWQGQVRGKGSRLPAPVAFLPGAAPGQVRVLWLRREGICCPSAASAWVSDVAERTTDGPRHVSGLGQPCD